MGSPYRASGVQWKVTRPAKGSPFGGAGASAPERARTLRQNKNTAIVSLWQKSLLTAVRRLCRNWLALSVIASQCHLSQRERLWHSAVFSVSFCRSLWYTCFAALPAHFIGKGVRQMPSISTFILSVAANVASYYICKWLDGWFTGRKH